jgi:O-antigen/teichoic acid export membrane protein
MIKAFINQAISSRAFKEVRTYTIANICSALIPFFLLPLLTRFLSPAEYGEVAIFQTIVGALAAFIGLNTAGASAREFYDDHLNGHHKNFIASCLQITLITGLIAFFVMFIFSGPLSKWLDVKVQLLYWAVLMAALSVVINIRLVQWQVRRQAEMYGGFQILLALSNVLISLLLVVVLREGAEGRISAQILSVLLFSILAIWMLKKDDLFKFFDWHPKVLRNVLIFGVPLVPHVAGSFLLITIDRLIIDKELGLDDLGIYMVAVQIVGVMSLLFGAINNAYVPWLYGHLKRNLTEQNRQIVLYTYIWFIFIVLLVAIVFICGPWLIRVIAGEKYVKAGLVIGWLSLGQAFTGMYLMVTNYIFYSRKTGLLSLSTITCGLVNVGLLVVLIRYIGLEGAAIASSVAMGIRFLLAWRIAQLRHPMPWFNFI